MTFLIKNRRTKEMTELKPCPFCGAPAAKGIRYEEHPSAPCTFYYVACTNCYAVITTNTSMEDVIGQWNRRVNE